MAVDSAAIGANFSQYTGDPSLGGFGLTQGRVDTRALEDLARYTMLYNKAEYDQRQKDAEKAAEELAKFASIDLSTSIPKDAKILQEKFDALSQYLKDNPNALNYRNRTEWLEYNKRKNDLNNDIKFATIRDIMNVKRKNAIAEEKNEGIKKLMEASLQKNIDATDIRTPLDHEQKYDLTVPEIADNKGIKIEITKEGPNQIFQRKPFLFDINEAKRNGLNYQLGVRSFDPSTPTGERRLLTNKENIWVKQSDIFNQALASAKDANGVVDVTKMQGVPFMANINAYNQYVKQTRDDIKNGFYTDKLGGNLSFGKGPVRAEDYQEIDINDADGLTPAEMSMVAEFSKWAGDSQETDVIQTNDDLERQRLALGWANHYLDEDKFTELKKKGESKLATDIVTADSVLSNVANAIKLHKPIDVPDDKTKTGLKRYLEVADINLVEKFGKLGMGDDGVPNDRLFLSQDENRFYLGRKDAQGNVKIGPQFSIEDWTDNLTFGKMGATERGDVNTIIASVLRNFQNDPLKFAYGYRGISPTIERGGGTTATQTESASSSTTNPPDDDSKLTDAQYYQKYKKFR